MPFWNKNKPKKTAFPRVTSYPKLDNLVSHPAPEKLPLRTVASVQRAISEQHHQNIIHSLRFDVMDKLIDSKQLISYKNLMKRIENIVNQQQLLSNQLHEAVRRGERRVKVKHDYERFLDLSDQYFTLTGKRMEMLKPEAANDVRNNVLSRARRNLAANEKIWLEYLANEDTTKPTQTHEEDIGAVGGFQPIDETDMRMATVTTNKRNSKVDSNSITGRSVAASDFSHASSKLRYLKNLELEKKEFENYMKEVQNEFEENKRKMFVELEAREKHMREEMVKMSEQLETLKLEKANTSQAGRVANTGGDIFAFDNEEDECEDRGDTVSSWMDENEYYLGLPPPDAGTNQRRVPQVNHFSANNLVTSTQNTQALHHETLQSQNHTSNRRQELGRSSFGNQNANVNQTQHQSFGLSNRLPKLKLTEFAGDPLEWPEWSGMFIASIHNSPLSNNEKMMHLKTLVTGKAKDAIAGMGFNGALYDAAWQTLNKKFGMPHIVVSSQLAKVKNFPSIKIHDSAAILEYGIIISNFVNVLKQFQYVSDLSASSNVEVLISKIPPNLKTEWFEYVEDNVYGQPSVTDFNDWLQQKVVVHEQLLRANPYKQTGDVRGKDRQQKSSKQTFTSTIKTKDSQVTPCVLGDGPHKLWTCPIFRKKSVKEKYEVLKKHHLCFACFGTNHSIRDCTMKACGIDGCQKKHNRMLHQDNQRDWKTKDDKEEVSTASQNASTSHGMLQLVKVHLSNGTQNATVLALCDNGANLTWIDASLKRQLQLSGNQISLDVAGIHGSETIESESVSVCIRDVKKKIEKTVVSAYVHPKINLGNSKYDLKSLKKMYSHLAVLPSETLCLSDVKVILGQDVYHLHRALEYRENGQRSPWAVRTELGWTVSGPIPKHLLPKVTAMVSSVNDMVLGDQLKQWWELESYGTTIKADPRSLDDKKAMAILEKTVKKNDKRYEVGLLWKDESVLLPNNYSNALSQFYSLERRLERDPELKQAYLKTIEDDIAKGYVKKLDVLHDNPGRTWYLPHHPVLNPNKPGKVRRVCNAAAKYASTSLNENLLAGPDLLNSLIGIIIRFREGHIGMIADIEAMFMQVEVPENDRSVLRILWREDSSKAVGVIEYGRHIFGAISSPTCANFVINQTADDNADEFPIGAVTVKRDLYMDDLAKAEKDLKSAMRCFTEVTSLLRRGGFELKKWQTNSREFYDWIPEELRLDDRIVTTLGLSWNVDDDAIYVVRGAEKLAPPPITQRKVLSIVSSVFDPIGLIAPFTIVSRKLLKTIWQENGQKWDDILNNEIISTFLTWVNDLKHISDIKLNRCYFKNDTNQNQLHVFADAAEDAMCVVAYIRYATNETVDVSFIMGKTRVAPLRKTSIPRLELQAALIANRIKDSIVRESTLNFDAIFLWSDSTTVIQWIRTSHKRQQVFVGNRVAEILDTSSVDMWCHLPGTLNPADLGTRGLTIEQLRASEWLTGPAWLREDETEWPNDITQCEDEIVSLQAKNEIIPDTLIDWSRFGNYRRIINMISFILKWRYPSLSQSDRLRQADNKLWTLVQKESFALEYAALQKGNELPSSSKLLPLTPFLDADELMRSSGRLKNANLDFNTKHPIILTSKHVAVKLYLIHCHSEAHHEGVEYLKSIIQQDKWVIGLRSSLRSVRMNCMHCKKMSAQNLEPIMADLPKERLSDRSFPFANTGVDYFGPFQVKLFRRTVKRWCCLFTCLSTRAVHIEVVSTLEADSCINAVNRFIARRGQPNVFVSDNGTNFVGAAREFRECFNKWDKDEVIAKLGQRKILWKFNPPAAPHFGGAWERLVRSCKRAMTNILGHRRLTDETLTTTMCLVEQILNARPLTPVSSDVRDFDALTPNHFLLGRPSVAVPMVPDAHCYESHRKRYLQCQAYADMIWTRWQKEYLPILNTRSKWQKGLQTPLAQDELVWVKDETARRGDFQMGRVIEVYRGTDGEVRSVKLKTQMGDLVRPVTKLIRLDVCSDAD